MSLGDRVNRFGLSLYAKLEEDEHARAVSPLAVAGALAMLGPAAQGRSRVELWDLLQLTGSQKASQRMGALVAQLSGDHGDGVRFLVGNHLAAPASITYEEKFVQRMRAWWRAEVMALDFRGDLAGSRAALNDRLLDDTGLDQVIVPGDVDVTTSLFLVSACRLDVAWKTPFSPEETISMAFSGLGGRRKVPTMVQTAIHDYVEGPALSLIRLPLAGDELSMYVFLPRDPDGLETVEAALTPDSLEAWFERVQPSPVRVHLPRFSIRTRLVLSQVLRRLKAQSFFTSAADFSAASPQLTRVSAAVAEAAITVDEGEGPRSSAVIPSGPVRFFTADHPFLFFVRHDASTTLLMMGRVADPHE